MYSWAALSPHSGDAEQPQFFSHFREVQQYFSELGLPKGMLEILPGITQARVVAQHHHLVSPFSSLWAEEDLGSEVVFWFDEWFIAFGDHCLVFSYVHVLSPHSY